MSHPTNQQLGQFPVPGEVRLVRILPGPIERIWEYLTDPEKRARWFAGGAMEPKAGGKLALVFKHEDLAGGEPMPESVEICHGPGDPMPGTVLRWEPPRVLSYTFGDASDVTSSSRRKAKKSCWCSPTAAAAKTSPSSPVSRAAGTLTWTT